jgi:hypothetical protein
MDNNETPLIAPEVKQPHTKKKVVFTIIVAVLLLTVALSTIIVFNSRKSDKKQVNTPEITSEQSPEATISAIARHMRSEITKDTQNTYQETSGTLGSARVTYKLDTDYLVTSLPETNGLLNFRVDPKNNNTPQDTASSQSALKQTISEANTYIQSLGFTELAPIEIQGVLGTAKPRTYKNMSIYCQIEDETYLTLSVSCVQEDKLRRAASELQPFIKIYEATGRKSSRYAELTKMEPKNGYDITKLYASEIGFALYFVSKTGTSDWQYLDQYSTQSIEECSKYESSDLARTIFAGEPCYVTLSAAKPGVPANQIERVVK